MRLVEVANTLGLKLEGNAELEVRGVAGLEGARPDELSFVTGERHRKAFDASSAGAFLVPEAFDPAGRPCLRSAAPYIDFVRAVELFIPEPAPPPGVHATACVAPDAVLGEGVSIGAYAVIGERVRIGERTCIHPHVTIYPGCEIGSDCVIHSAAQIRSRVRMGSRVVIQNGAVIGSDGFGFAFRPDGTRVRVPHRSGVEIGDDVEIGANTTIDASHPAHPRGADGSSATRIGNGVKIDNHVQVAHGCELGEGTTLCSHVGLAGRTIVGRHVFFAGHAATSGDLRVGDGTAVLGMSGVMSDTEPGSQLVGVPVQPRRVFFRVLAATKRLPDLLKRVARIERHLDLDGKGED